MWDVMENHVTPFSKTAIVWPGEPELPVRGRRRKIFEYVARADQPIGAYQILDGLRQGGERIQPPTVYRALSFLIGRGLIHRIESQNAFVACSHFDHEHDGQFLICSNCGHWEELIGWEVPALLRRQARALGFALQRQTVELNGLCKDCAEKQRD